MDDWGQAGKDVAACLNEAMKRQGLDMRVSALVCFAARHISSPYFLSICLENYLGD